MKPNTCGETWTSWQTIFQPRDPNHNKLSNELDPMEAGLGVVATEVGDATGGCAGWDGTGLATATSTEGATGATSTEGAGSGATSTEGAGTAPTSTAGASTASAAGTSTTGAGGAASAEWASSDGASPSLPFPLSASDSLLEESQASSSSGLMSSCGEKQKLKTNTYKHKFINQGKWADNIKPRHNPLPKTQCVLPPPLFQSFFRLFVDSCHFLLRRWHTKIKEGWTHGGKEPVDVLQSWPASRSGSKISTRRWNFLTSLLVESFVENSDIQNCYHNRNHWSW